MDLVLPTEPQEPALDGLLYRRIVLSGAQKIGKTTTGIGFTERPLILDAEGSAEGYRCLRQPIPDWRTFRATLDLLKGGHNYTAFVVDTADELARHCQDHVISSMVGRENDLDTGEFHHPSDFEYGKGWSAVSEEFRLRVSSLCMLGVPVLFISHEKDFEVTDRLGTRRVFQPDVGNKGMRNWLLGYVDVILRAAIEQTPEGPRHVIIAQPSNDNLVGGRRPPGGAPLPPFFPLGGPALYHVLSAREPSQDAAAAAPAKLPAKAKAKPAKAAA